MSNKPSIIFNPDFNRLVLDPLTNRLITVGEIHRRTAHPAPVVSKKAAAAQAVPAVLVVPATPAVIKPVSIRDIIEKQAAAKQGPAKPVGVVPAPAKPVSIKTIGTKPVAKEVKFDNNIPVSRPFNKGPLIIPAKGGYGAVISGRGRR